MPDTVDADNGGSFVGDEPTFAILLCNYNHAECLPRALAGIFGQTRPADEILLLDDGSRDGSSGIMEEFARDDPRVRIIHNETNRGLLDSIPLLLEMARSDYVVWAASDDELLPDFLAEAHAVLSRHPGTGICFSELNVVPAKGAAAINYSRDPELFEMLADTAATFRLYDIPEYLSPEWLRKRFADRYLCFSSNTVAMNRQLLVEAGGFPRSLKWHADWFAIYLIAFRAGACCIPKALTRLHDGGESFSNRGMNDPTAQTTVLKSLLAAVGAPENRDIRKAFAGAPAVFAPFGLMLLRVGIGKPRYWDLIVPYFIWYLRTWTARSGLSGWQIGGRIMRRLARKVWG